FVGGDGFPNAGAAARASANTAATRAKSFLRVITSFGTGGDRIHGLANLESPAAGHASEAKAVDAGVVRAEPVAEAAAGDGERPEDLLPEGPVPARLGVGGRGHLREVAAEEDEAARSVGDRLVRHEALVVEAREARHHRRVRLRRGGAAPGDLERRPHGLAAG